jgi:hypothetical protein
MSLSPGNSLSIFVCVRLRVRRGDKKREMKGKWRRGECAGERGKKGRK